MQFYIIDKDPKTNAELLPDYALLRVNVREGWQILSDICHRFVPSVRFTGQNRRYNPWHARTRSLSDKVSFSWFMLYYKECCDEYKRRTGKSRKEIESFENLNLEAFNALLHKALPATAEQETAWYMCHMKHKLLTQEEYEALRRM